MMTTREVIYLKDYEPTPFVMKHVDLDFELYPEHTDVTSRIQIKRRNEKSKDGLYLDGRDLELLSVSIDGKKLKNSEYEASPSMLSIPKVPKECVIEIKNRIKPHLNTNLEGLYTSEGMYCTQCEAAGFRGITYFYDRPDVMLTFKVRICANKEHYPVLLSNGNFIDKGESSDGRHWTVWEDPFPKPCYLFALVAGKLEVLEDNFTSMSGKNIRLAIYADKKDIDKCSFAMLSLKQSLKWDEDHYGRECDLEDYKVVAVRDFNMGAMENKGLNIFNTSLVLASQQTTTDSAFQRISSVIAHEYFHNWTGNRVTCRDWFQLCLKEGLTVFRDQEFSQTIGSEAVERIDQVNMLRTYQYPEDDGPTAHPPRPDKFIEINNFYTVTVYEKGAEVVRMLKTLLGPTLFRKGMDLYFEKFDGQAVTQEDFVQCFAEVSKRDLSQFFLWYSQAGAPHITVEDHFDEKEETYTLSFSQKTPPTPEEKTKKAFHIPITVSLFQNSGKAFELFQDSKTQSSGEECTLEMTENTQSFTFHKIKSKPIPSLFRRSSAPVRLKTPLSSQESLFLMKHDTDPINAWDAAQKVMGREILQMCKNIQNEKKAELSSEWKEAFAFVLSKQYPDTAFQARLITAPSFEVLAQQMETIDPEALVLATREFKKQIAKEHKELLLKTYKDHTENGHFSIETRAVGRRFLKNACLSYLNSLDDSVSLELILNQYQNANNMTDRFTALQLIANRDTKERQQIIDHFYENWKHEEEVVDSWFNAQARSQLPGTFEEILNLTTHPAFEGKNPNRIRSLIFAFAKGNPLHFHSETGQAYAFCADKVIEIDAYNRQLAAGLVRSFSSWRRYKVSLQNKMRAELERIHKHKGLSSDVYELIHKIL